ncbi:zinc finger BED domain-containing protein RICESLEEPER 3-like [Andrographis paniculata]|uniref:zinc finger BED domain-containing protein RICESLEEPER 3-like n=1 Tax=Andrographis paniculata TaxID=175694 RepID=UPI0021E79AF7|nr:zinc finger BED domain-containing protein RICESLEEPER 3-like [Andrographis paniculata]
MEFREFAVLTKFASTSIVPMDVKTRWNATYKMFDVALKYQRVFERMAEEWVPFMNYFSEKSEKEYKEMNGTSSVGGQNMEIECSSGNGFSGGGCGLCDELFECVNAQNEEDHLEEISNEVDKYLANDIEKQSNPSFNLLEWWKGSETKYPVLSMVAKDIFAIPSSTVASEFSLLVWEKELWIPLEVI